MPGYNPTDDDDDNDNQNDSRSSPKKTNYKQNSGSFNQRNNVRQDQRDNRKGNGKSQKSNTVAGAWRRDDGSIFVKFTGDKENDIPAFNMYLNESKFAGQNKKPDFVAFKTLPPKENND